MTREELQTHIYSWTMGRTIQTAHVNRRLGLLRIRFAADVMLLVRLASYRGVIHQHKTIDMRAVMDVNVHPGACTLALGLSEPKQSLRAMQSIEKPSSQLVMFLSLGVKTPVRIFSGSGADVTTQFGPAHENMSKQAEERAKHAPKFDAGGAAYEHSWSAADGFKTRRRGPAYTNITLDDLADSARFAQEQRHGPRYTARELDEAERQIVEAFKAGIVSADETNEYLRQIEIRRLML